MSELSVSKEAILEGAIAHKAMTDAAFGIPVIRIDPISSDPKSALAPLCRLKDDDLQQMTWFGPRTLHDPAFKAMSYREIGQWTAAYCGFTYAKLLIGRRKGKHSRARWLFWYLLIKHKGLSLNGVGRLVGRDHSSVNHGVRMICAEKNLAIPFQQFPRRSA